MSDTAMFIGWGDTHPGREHHAQKTYAEFLEVLERLEAEGVIERYETVLLEPHGGELDGFTLIYGTPEKLASLPLREDLHRLRMRATLDHGKFSVIWATTGEAVKKEFALIEEIVTEYEHALV